MSSAVVSTSAALGRPFIFGDDSEPEVSPLSGPKKPAGSQELSPESPITRFFQSTNHQKSTIPLVTPASRLEIRPAPEMVSSGIPALDTLTGGLPRGCLTEICGPASSGRTTVLLAAVAAATRRGEFCALIDASDALDPLSAAAVGIDLERLLWVRCGEISPQSHRDTQDHANNKAAGRPTPAASFAPRAWPELGERLGNSAQASLDFRATNKQSEHRLDQVLRATDLLLESGGFGLIILDLADLPSQSARRIPLTTWFRFRRAVEHKPTILLAIEQQPIAGSCSSLLLQLNAARQDSRERLSPQESVLPTHAHLLSGLQINAELIRSRLDRKPARSVSFATKAAWAG